MRTVLGWLAWTLLGVLVARAWPTAAATSWSRTYSLELRRVDTSCVYPEDETCGFPDHAHLEVTNRSRGGTEGFIDLGELGVVVLTEVPDTDGGS